MIYAIHKTTKEHRAISAHTRCGADEWRYAEADPDGWIEWHGGECPLPDDVKCEVKLKDGWTSEARAGDFATGRWMDPFFAFGEGIIAYRPILDADTKPEPPFSRDLGINALAERPLWDGESWPPSEGARVEVREANDHSFMFATVRAIGMLKERTRIAVTTDCGKLLTYHGTHGKHGLMVRPIRSEEDRAVDAMVEGVRNELGSGCYRPTAEAIYHAIRDGKVSGVRLAAADGEDV